MGKKFGVSRDFVLSAIKSTVTTEKGRSSTAWSFIRCPFHNEKTPSLQIWHDASNPDFVGSFKCRGCGVSGAWSKLADAKNYPKPQRRVSAFVTIEDSLLAQAESAEEDSAKAMTLPEYASKFNLGPNDRWRGFAGWFIEETGAIAYTDTRNNTNWLWLPVSVQGRIRGYIRARWSKEIDKTHSTPEKTVYKPSYLNSPGLWSKTKGLYLYDQAARIIQRKKLDYCILCEGPRDGLRLLSRGLPAMSILGVHTWSDRKIELLQLLGVRYIFIVMDGDSAGQGGAKMLRTGVAPQIPSEKAKGNPPKIVAKPLTDTFKVKNFVLSDDHDPASAPSALIKELENFIHETIN